MQKNISLYRNFLSPVAARKLRNEFADVYKNPRATPNKRFVWDHWQLNSQYRMHRALARDFFSASSFNHIKNQLVRFGQDQLGCHSISEPWLSYYTEGDGQDLHTDSPHGPWAFVYSLTPTIDFSGGETQILKPQTLSYWSHFSRERGYELTDLAELIPPRFNQLLVFDPRLPHGVTTVRGVRDPLKARLVLHGWFVNPEPFVVGGLKLTSITPHLNRQLTLLLKNAAIPETLFGTLTLAISISRSGQVTHAKPLTNSLVDREGKNSPSQFVKEICHEFRNFRFPRSTKTSLLTLPLMFD